MKRVLDWQVRLNNYFVDVQARYNESGLVWGTLDCCIFAADWVEVATGVDPMADFRGHYSSAGEAAEIVREWGEGSLLATLVGLFGEAIPPAQSKRGDLAYRREENAIGIVYTSGARQLAAFLSEAGFSSLPMKNCDAAFRVGD